MLKNLFATDRKNIQKLDLTWPIIRDEASFRLKIDKKELSNFTLVFVDELDSINDSGSFFCFAGKVRENDDDDIS